MDNQPKLKSTPKDVFLHLFNILIFYISVIGLIRLYVTYIGVLFPDALNFYFTGLADSVRWSTSVLLIGVPVYLLTAWMIAKDFKSVPAKRELSLRKWLVYLTLFVSAVTIIIDLIVFVNNFLSGELTIQFFLKVLVVLVIAAAVFWYYLWDLKRQNLQSKTPRILVWLVSIFVLGSLVAGFFIVGTPADQRQRRFDDQRVQHLQMLQSQIVNYWTQKQVLPAELSQLNDSISGFLMPADPETAVAYEYQAEGPLNFKLCATFSRVSQDYGSAVTKPLMVYDSFQQNWEHQADYTCFAREIDPDLYKNDLKAQDLVAPVRY